MSITLIIGPMFSGKTSELFRLLRRENYANNSIRVYKYDKDARYRRKELACSHDGNEHPAIPINDLTNESVPTDIKVIGIDEGQFMKGLVDFCQKNAENGKIVIVSGLDSDFKRNPFERITNLIPKAEHIHKLSAICILCKSDAYFTRRLTSSDQIEVIGGAESYIPSCRSCFYKDIDQNVLLSYQNKVKSKVFN